MTESVAFVLKGYPRLSETFIAQEIRALERLGLGITIISLRHPTDRHRHPIHDEIRAPVSYLPEYLYQEPWRVVRAWWAVRHRPTYAAARRLWLRDLWRDRTPNRVRRFGQALVLAAELDPSITHLHAHFLHTPASVARYAGVLMARPWSCSAHAKDVWTIPTWEKAEKLASCVWLATCSAINARHLAALAPPGRVHLVYHGLDFDRFPPARRGDGTRDGRADGAPAIILSVGRAVPKKGYDDLLGALAALPHALEWRFVHIGGGALTRKLRRRAARLGLAQRIEWRGAQPADRVLAAYRAADLFVLACRITRDGDRDGLPNVLIEAQSQGLPCIATAVSAIPELIEDGATGLLVPPGDVAALAAAIARLMSRPDERRRLGNAGEAKVRAGFDSATGIATLAALFGLNVEVPQPQLRQRA
ncbi:MAG: glycosyltransferase family 4 protein [Alphaproteobacteria bacterium]|nr:glycosyltransferase family 4 protein [Alphaproteobacteria bacterium]